MSSNNSISQLVLSFHGMLGRDDWDDLLNENVKKINVTSLYSVQRWCKVDVSLLHGTKIHCFTNDFCTVNWIGSQTVLNFTK